MLLRWVLFMAIFAFGVGVLVSYAGLVFGWGRSLPLVTGSSRRSIEVAAGLYGIWILTRPLLVAASRVRSPASSIAELLEPGASVVIPCSNAAGQLDETVRTILAQTYRPLEIILVENNSADDTWNVCQRLEREHPGIVRAARVDVHAWEYACSVAVNVGVRVARYEGIIRMDCDTIMAETMIEKAMLELRRPGTSAVAVNLRISNPTSSLITRLQSIEYLLAMELDRRFQGMFDSVVCCSGGLSAYRRSTILSSGGFCSAPKWVSEDLDMTMKAHRLGYVRTAPSAIGYTEGPETIRGIIRQRARWGNTGIVAFFLHHRGFHLRTVLFEHRGVLLMEAQRTENFERFVRAREVRVGVLHDATE